MGLKEKFDELNEQPNAIYIYIAAIIAVLFILGLIANPKAMQDTISLIVGSLFLLLLCYFCFKFCGRGQQQQQQQQQQIIMQTGDKKMRVCPKCGMQNDVTNRFCGDCGYEFKKPND